MSLILAILGLWYIWDTHLGIPGSGCFELFHVQNTSECTESVEPSALWVILTLSKLQIDILADVVSTK